MSGGRGGQGGVQGQPGFNPNPFGPGNGAYGGGVKPPFNPTPGVGPTMGGGYMNPNMGAGAVDTAGGWGSNAHGTFSADPAGGNMAGPGLGAGGAAPWGGTTGAAPTYGKPAPDATPEQAASLGTGWVNPPPSNPGGGLLGGAGSNFGGGKMAFNPATFKLPIGNNTPGYGTSNPNYKGPGNAWDPNNPAGPFNQPGVASQPGLADQMGKIRSDSAAAWEVQPGQDIWATQKAWIQSKMSMPPAQLQAYMNDLYSQLNNEQGNGPLHMRYNELLKANAPFPQNATGSLPIWGAPGTPGAHEYVPQGGIPGAPGSGR